MRCCRQCPGGRLLRQPESAAWSLRDSRPWVVVRGLRICSWRLRCRPEVHRGAFRAWAGRGWPCGRYFCRPPVLRPARQGQPAPAGVSAGGVGIYLALLDAPDGGHVPVVAQAGRRAVTFHSAQGVNDPLAAAQQLLQTPAQGDGSSVQFPVLDALIREYVNG